MVLGERAAPRPTVDRHRRRKLQDVAAGPLRTADEDSPAAAYAHGVIETRWRELAARPGRALLAAAVGLACTGAYAATYFAVFAGQPGPMWTRLPAGLLVLHDDGIPPAENFYPVLLLAPPWAAALAMLITLSVPIRHRIARSMTVLAVVAWLAAAMWPAVMLAAYDIGAREHRSGRLWWTAGLVSALTGGPLFVASTADHGIVEGTGTLLVAVGVLVWLPMLLGLWLSTRRRLVVELRERLHRAERDQVARAEQARIEERVRIAGEMHDVVAHRVSLMVLHAGGIEVSSSDDRSVRSAALIRGTGREALTELRDMLSVLSRPFPPDGAPTAPVPNLTDLDRLLDQTRAAGIEVIRRDHGRLDDLPAAVGRTAYRVVREGLTNVIRHAGHTDVEVALRRASAALHVTVHNGRPTCLPATPPVSGYGLVALRERVELLGGTLTAGPAAPGGFTLQARLPLDPMLDGERADGYGVAR